MFSFLLQASNAAAEAAPATDSGQAGWVTIVTAVVMGLITVFLLPWLRQQANKARAEAEKAKSESTGAQLSNKDLLIAQAKAFALDFAASIAEKRFPALAQKIKDGALKANVDTLKEELRSWGAVLKDKIIEHFKEQGVDIVVALGDKYLDDLIEWAANKVSPFPGKDTAKALLTEWDGKALEFLATKGVEWVKNRVTNENETAGQ